MDDENAMKRLNPLAFSWLKNGIYALAIAGIYSIVLVVLRTPQISHMIDNKELFKSALIVHVNLSVLVWLMSITAVFWSYGLKNFAFDNSFSRIAFAGLVLMSISPFVGEATPIMNNYIPMLENLSFVVGLSLFGVATLFFATTTLILSFYDLRSPVTAISTLGIFKMSSAAMYILSWLAITLSYLELEEIVTIVPIDIEFYYELLYWSGGHLLQFVYTQSLMMALIILFEALIGHKLHLIKLYRIFFILNLLLALPIFLGHASYEIIDGAFKEYFTKHMIYSGGIVPAIFIFTILYDYFVGDRKNTSPTSRGAIISSLTLFVSGGLIGACIAGINVTIPAHYHGSVVGISAAFMGIAYLYCYHREIRYHAEMDGFVSVLLGSNVQYAYPKESNVTKTSHKGPLTQLFLFTLGQAVHISGLALAGGYGVLRKNPDDIIPLSAKIYMGMVGGGGLFAIIGGLMFVWICVKKLKSI